MKRAADKLKAALLRAETERDEAFRAATAERELRGVAEIERDEAVALAKQGLALLRQAEADRDTLNNRVAGLEGECAGLDSAGRFMSALLLDALHDLAKVEDVYRFGGGDLDGLYDDLCRAVALEAPLTPAEAAEVEAIEAAEGADARDAADAEEAAAELAAEAQP